MLKFCLFLMCLTVSVQAENSTFINKEKGYSITFPLQWEWQKDFMGLDIFASAPTSEDQIGSTANISVISAKVEGEVSLETFFNSNVDHLKTALRDMQVLETGKVVLEGEGRKVIYKHTMGDMKLRVVQYFLLKNGSCYIVTCTAVDNEFPQYAERFEKSVRTFVIL